MPLDPRTIAELREAIASMGAEAAAILMRHYRRLDAYEKKGAIDLVTVADKESEAAVLAAITKRFPGHAVLAEESGSGGVAASDFLWIIDPLDGTTNFAHGMPNFAVSIAVAHQGTVVAGGVFAPALGETYLAGRGLGATRNGEPIHVSRVARLDESLVVTGFPYDRATHVAWLMETMGRFLCAAQGMLRLGSAALDLAYVAAGNLEGFYESNLHAWDMAAGSLLVEEAGGRMSTFTGNNFTVFTDNMLASNGAVHGEMMALLAMAPWEQEKQRTGN